MDGKESDAADNARPGKQQQGTGNGGCPCCPCCDRLASLLESRAAEKVRLDDNQRDGGGGNESETIETGRPGEHQQQGAGNDKEPSGASLLESRAVKRVRLDDNQRDGGDGNESETVETGRPGEQQHQGAGNDKEPSGDDRQRRAIKVGLSSGGCYYRRHRDDPEWRAAQAAKRAQREPPKPIDPQRMPTIMKLLDVVSFESEF